MIHFLHILTNIVFKPLSFGIVIKTFLAILTGVLHILDRFGGNLCVQKVGQFRIVTWESLCSECKVRNTSIVEELDEQNRKAVTLGVAWVWVGQL